MVLEWLASLFSGDVDSISGDQQQFATSFKKVATAFYDLSEWEPISLRDGKVHYALRKDPHRALVVGRLLDISQRCATLWKNVQRGVYPERSDEIDALRKCLAPKSVSHIAQKPPGGYDVRAYAHGSWIFLELPTFHHIETGADGINTTEERRRQTMWDILLHELAHVAGYWDHDADHDKCIAWLREVSKSMA